LYTGIYKKGPQLKNYSLKILFGKNLVNYNIMKQRLVIRLFEFLIVENMGAKKKQSVFQNGYFLKNVKYKCSDYDFVSSFH
jgi:hypothetical protein